MRGMVFAAGLGTRLRPLTDRLPKPVVPLLNRPLASYGPRELALERAMLAQSVDVAFPFTVIEIVRMGAGDRRGAFVSDAVEHALSQVDGAPARDLGELVAADAAARRAAQGRLAPV